MLAPTVFQSDWNVPVEPVKCSPARAGSASATWESCEPSPVTMLITPGGSPASSSSRIRWNADRVWAGAGFHTTVLPIRAGAVGRLPAIAVKLNGVTA